MEVGEHRVEPRPQRRGTADTAVNEERVPEAAADLAEGVTRVPMRHVASTAPDQLSSETAWRAEALRQVCATRLVRVGALPGRKVRNDRLRYPTGQVLLLNPAESLLGSLSSRKRNVSAQHLKTAFGPRHPSSGLLPRTYSNPSSLRRFTPSAIFCCNHGGWFSTSRGNASRSVR